MSIILARGRGRSETQRYNGELCEGEVRGCSDISARYCQQPPEKGSEMMPEFWITGR